MAAAPAYNLDSPAPPDAPPHHAPSLQDETPVPLRWPYLDLEYGGLELENRYQTFGMLWVHIGAYGWERLHLTARVGFAQADAEDITSQAGPPGFGRDVAPDEALPDIYGNLGVGYVFSSNGGFVFAPGLTLHLSDKGDYGYGAGVMIPFVWVTRGGFRIGFEASAMRTFGGSVRFTCTATQVDAPCDFGEVREFTRDAASGFSAGFIVGYGID